MTEEKIQAIEETLQHVSDAIYEVLQTTLDDETRTKLDAARDDAIICKNNLRS